MPIYEGYCPEVAGESGFPVVETLKAHIVTIQNPASANAWNDFTSFQVVTAETNGNYMALNADGKTIDITAEGLYQFGGCVHFQNNSGGLFTTLSVLSRIFKNGTTESRCSQRDKTLPGFANGAQDVLSYGGTDYLVSGDSLNLQYYTNQINVDFISNSNFQSQVAATIWLNYLGTF